MDRAVAAHIRPLRLRAPRPLPRVRGLLAIPADAATALGGRWERGPGRALFDAAAAELGELPVLAEDLGDIDAPVIELRRALGLPGMAVLQFGFNPDDDANTHHPANLEQHQVVYTGTHDNDTVCGWWRTCRKRRAMVRAALRRPASPPTPTGSRPWAVIGLALAMPCELAMMQAQDVLALGSEARMNAPGIEGVGAGRWSPALSPTPMPRGCAPSPTPLAAADSCSCSAGRVGLKTAARRRRRLRNSGPRTWFRTR